MVLKSKNKIKFLLSILMMLGVGAGISTQHESVVKAEGVNFEKYDPKDKSDHSGQYLLVAKSNYNDETGSYITTNGFDGTNSKFQFIVSDEEFSLDSANTYANYFFTFNKVPNKETYTISIDNYYIVYSGNSTYFKRLNPNNFDSENENNVWELEIQNDNTIKIMSGSTNRGFAFQKYIVKETSIVKSRVAAYSNSNFNSSGYCANFTFYKKVAEKKIVTFNPNAGNDDVSYSSELATEIQVKINETIPEEYQQLEVHRQGYKFLGWFKEASAENKFDFSLPITEDTTIYAGWEKVTTQHKVTFDENGGTPLQTNEIQVLENSWIEDEQVPTTTRDGYKLLGWYVTENGETRKWDFENKEVVTKDVTLKAKWILNEAYEFTQSAADSRLSVSYTKEETSSVEKFVKVTKPSDTTSYDWSGEYLITSIKENKVYVFTGNDSKTTNIGEVDGDNLIVDVNSENFAKIKIDKINNGETYSLKIEKKGIGQECYLSDKSGNKTNGIDFYTDAADAPNTISWSSNNNYYVTIKGKNGHTFAMNNAEGSEGWFRYFHSSQNPITLYRYVPGTQTNYDVTFTTIGYGLTFNANAHYETAKYGMFLANVDEATKDLKFDVETMDINKDSDITLDEVKNVLTGKGFNQQYQYTDLTLNKTDEKGEILELGNYYTMGVKFTFKDKETLPIDDWILAIGYMEVDGQIYFSLPTIHSLRDLVKIYQSNEGFLQQQPDAKGVLNVLGAL